MRAASTAAFFALSTPTQATGTPGGICAIESSASSPPPTDIDEVSGTPMTGSSRVGGDHARQRRGQPGAGDDHPQAAHLRVLRVVGDRVGVAVGGHHAHLVADAALVELLRRLLHRRHVALGAHEDADARGVDLHVLELGLDRRLGGELGLAHACSAMSRRSWRPSNSIMSAAAYAASRAAADVVAERGHVEHAPARRDHLAARLRGARVEDLDAGRDAVEAGDHVAGGGRLRVARRGEHDRHGRARVPLELDARQAARLRRPHAAGRAGRSAGAAARPASRDRRSGR